MKKRVRPGYILLALNLVILAAAGWMFYQAYQLRTTAQPQGFHPIVTSASENAVAVGQMRLPKDVDRTGLFGTCAESKEVQVQDYVPAGQTYNGQDLKEGHSLLVVRIKDPTGESNGDFNYTIYRYCEEDGFWYQMYYTSFASRGYASMAEEWDRYFEIPSDVLEEPGKYIIEIKNMNGRVGACTFQLPLED